jgi:hypothetical protein
VGPVAKTDFVFDVTGIGSWHWRRQGNPDNETRSLNIGANAHVIGIGWDITLTAFDRQLVIRVGGQLRLPAAAPSST